MTLLESLTRQARDRGDHPFLLHEGRSITFGEFDRATNRMAHALAGLGVERGDRVTLALGNSIEWTVAAFGTLKAGALLNPVNPGLGGEELGFVLAHAAPRVVITTAERAGLFAGVDSILPSGSQLAAFEPLAGADNLARRCSTAPETPLRRVIGPEDGSTLLYTSGTTGRPKGVLFTHGRSGGSGSFFIENMEIGREDVLLAVGPLFHGNSWSSVTVALQAGCTAAFPRQFSASEFWPLARDVGATRLFTLGTILAILLAQPEAPGDRDHTLRVVLGLGSAPIRDRLCERFGFAHILECFGSTDAGVVTLEPRGALPRPGSAGPALPGITIHILDDEGRELPRGEIGEIAIDSPHRMAEYFRDPERTAAALKDDLFLTGDLGRLDDDGWLFFVDRKRDVIRRGGENVSSAFVEKVLREHPAVADAAVVGVHHPVLGQEIKAFIIPKGTLDITDLEAFARARLARFQVPRLWETRTDFPRTPTQRVEKYKLRAESEGGEAKPLLG